MLLFKLNDLVFRSLIQKTFRDLNKFQKFHSIDTILFDEKNLQQIKFQFI